MKKLVLVALLLGATLHYFSACQDFPIEWVIPESAQAVSTECDALRFKDRAHFQEVYEYLDEAYNLMEESDSTKVLDDFEASMSFLSLRTHVDQIEDQMDDDGIEITDANDPDVLFFEDDVMKTLLDPNGIVFIGNYAYLLTGECAIFRTRGDCEGKSRLIELKAALNNLDQEAIQGHLSRGVELINDCDIDGTTRGPACGIIANFIYNVEWGPSGKVKIVCNDASSSNSGTILSRIWRATQDTTTRFGSTVTYTVPQTEELVEICLTVVNGRFCTQEICKRVYIKCGIDFDYSVAEDGKTVQFNIIKDPAVQYSALEWSFGDGTTSTEESPIHEYDITCPRSFDVGLVLQNLQPSCAIGRMTKTIDISSPCLLQTAKNKGRTTNAADNQKIKWKIKQKPSWLTGKHSIKTKIKYKKRKSNGRWRKRRTKLRIELFGNIYTSSTQCEVESLDGNGRVLSNSKKMKYKYIRNSTFYYNVLDPYSVRFTGGDVITIKNLDRPCY